jgi:hypothetical protein
MSTFRITCSLALGVSLLIFSAAAYATTPPDSTLYTSYFFESGYQTMTWIVCGSTAQSEGCFGSGSLGPFGRAGAMIEGNPIVNLTTNTVSRFIYVVDIASGSSGTGVTLYVYKKTDTVTASSDTISVKLVKTVGLPLTGGAAATCSMAANKGFLFIGTDQSPQAVRVQKSNLSTLLVGGFSPSINVTSITSDKYGYVTVTFGGFLSGEDGFYTFGPSGQGEGDGGGAWFMLSTDTGLSTTALPAATSMNLAERLQVHPKAMEQPTGPE